MCAIFDKKRQQALQSVRLGEGAEFQWQLGFLGSSEIACLVTLVDSLVADKKIMWNLPATVFGKVRLRFFFVFIYAF